MKASARSQRLVVAAAVAALATLLGVVIPALQRFEARQGAARERPRETEVLLVSFPKSGSNWLRFLVAGLDNGGENVTFASAEAAVPDLEYGPNRLKFQQPKRPRFWKSHQPRLQNHSVAGVGASDHALQGWPRCTDALANVEQFQCLCPNCPLRWRRILLVVRDGRSALCSYYRFQRDLGNVDDVPFSQFLASNKSKYGFDWADHALSYLASDDSFDLKVVRYEDLRADPLAAVADVARWLGLSSDVKRVVEHASIENMRRLEDEAGTPLFDKEYPDARQKRGFRLVRDGNVDGYRACGVTPGSLFEAHLPRFAEAMHALGYEYE